MQLQVQPVEKNHILLEQSEPNLSGLTRLPKCEILGPTHLLKIWVPG